MVVKDINEITSLYRQATAFPSVTSGNLEFQNDNILTVHSQWSQRDIDRKEKVTLQRVHVFDVPAGKTISQTDPQEVNNTIWNKKSPSGNLRAVVRSGKDKKNEDKQYLEIYDKTKKLKTIDILALEKHGKIVGNDGQFGSFEWSSSEDNLLYVAEKKKPKTKSFFDKKEEKGDLALKDEEKGDGRGCENEYRESWGEQLIERHRTVICVIDVEMAIISLLENVDDSLSPGQAVWSPDDAGVVFCAWTHEPYRLGLKHCCQRTGGLYFLDLQKGTVESLTSEGRTARFPRFSPDMSRLIYMDTPVGGAHHQCSRLLMIDWATKTTNVVVDVVRHAPATSFQGIFTATLQRNVWFDDNIHVAFSTAWRSSTVVVIVNTNTGTVKQLCKDGDTKQCFAVLDIKKSCILMSSSSPSSPFHLVLAQLQDVEDVNSAQWFYPDGTPETVDWFSSWGLLTHKPTPDRVSSINGNLDYESILCLPTKDKDGRLPPLIVHSHGGPHVSVDTTYNSTTSFFCLCGYAVLMVNYRGSWGFGQDSIESLLGTVGEQEVKDVESAMLSAISKGAVDGNRVLAFGGSHGGFITTHLVGQYPKTFKAASTRNPVTNLVSMWSSTDIRDWIFIEGGFSFDMASLASEEVLPNLWKRSPLSHVNQVITPVLLLVGLEDKRVPPNQTMEYYKALKARKVPVRCLTYPSSNHSLSEVDVESDSIVNTIVWYNTYV